MNPLDDLDIFFSDFATPAIITPPGWQVQVLFDLNSMDQMGILTDKPQIIIKDSDLAAVDLKTATITVLDRYPEARMTKAQSDGLGLTTLLLTRV